MRFYLEEEEEDHQTEINSDQSMKIGRKDW